MHITSDTIFNVMKKHEKKTSKNEHNRKLEELIDYIDTTCHEYYRAMVSSSDVETFKIITTTGITFDVDSEIVSHSGVSFDDIFDEAITCLNKRHKSFLNLNSSAIFAAEVNPITGYYVQVRVKLKPGFFTPIPNV